MPPHAGSRRLGASFMKCYDGLTVPIDPRAGALLRQARAQDDGPCSRRDNLRIRAHC